MRLDVDFFGYTQSSQRPAAFGYEAIVSWQARHFQLG